ncbi:MAG: urease subunit gamma, partial [Solirubrobacteraceae bacterium]|nr:urease subunit gamma [Solirubrobacteraceae bacterium]
MKLTPVEQERLLIFLAAELARRRRAAGLRLNHPEAVALISDELMEAGRAGRSYDEVRALGYRVLSEDDVLEG